MSVKELNITPPDPEIIEYIEYLLERAKDGEVQSLAVVGSRGNSTTFNALVQVEKNNMAIIGELEILKTDIIHLMVELRCDTG